MSSGALPELRDAASSSRGRNHDDAGKNDGLGVFGAIGDRRCSVKSVAAVFTSRADAERGAAAVHTEGVPKDRISLLTPHSTAQVLEKVPVTDAEQPGIGTALGAAVGGSVGIAGGFWLGAILTTVFLPGVGAIAALGAIGATILGALGAVGGGAIGHAADSDLSEGISGDEMFVYEDALRQGRSVVIALAENDDQAGAARAALTAAGAESIDKARHMWWIGVRDVEKEKYKGDFDQDERFFRRGFEAALDINQRDKTFDESLDELRWRYQDSFDHSAFRKGYDRGRAYLNAVKGVETKRVSA